MNTDPRQPLTAEQLQPYPVTRLARRVILLAEIDSTNRYLLDQARTLPDGTIVWAEHQTAGRGRLGRRWSAPPGSSVLMSALLIEPPDTPLLSGATMLASVAACEAIRLAAPRGAELRWPNDLVIDGRKVGGVLTESRLLSSAEGRAAQRAVVIGVGINCSQRLDELPADTSIPPTSLQLACGRPIDRARLARSLLERLDAWLESARAEPVRTWTALRAAWAAACRDAGTRATLVSDGCARRGTILEIRPDGALRVRLDDGSERCFVAETTTRID